LTDAWENTPLPQAATNIGGKLLQEHP